jgi:hypothetical protein
VPTLKPVNVMATDQQIHANKEKARLIAGTKPSEGKAYRERKTRSAAGSASDGLSAREAALPEEERAEYLELLAALEAEHQPRGPVEAFLVREMATAQWRLARIGRIETGVLMNRMEENRDAEGRHAATARRAQFTAAELAHDEITSLLGFAFSRSCKGDPFSKLSRYENNVRRAYYKALETLRKIRLKPLPPPQPAVDLAQPCPPASEEPVPREPDSLPEAPAPSPAPNEPESLPDAAAPEPPISKTPCISIEDFGARVIIPGWPVARASQRPLDRSPIRPFPGCYTSFG